jgi:succinate--hydroxymethylglutarate CoA-transferase
MAVEIDHATIGPLRVLGTPFKLSNTPASVRTAPPTLGQHTEAVLMHDLGLSAGHVAALRGKGVI